MADPQTDSLANERPLRGDVKATDVLANERTFLAYVRTALAFIAFGFVVARFGLFVEELSQYTHIHNRSPHYSIGFGVSMAGVGVLIGILGAWRYGAVDRAMQANVIKSLPRAGGYIISLLVAAIGLFVALFLATSY
ncbi:MAG TPA: DUF202 domain-containing protein [Candidatus Aquilonibacter sp.]|nr:DUF202 domain-containing protein [Candidatus Aquilonibacter sp.]